MSTIPTCSFPVQTGIFCGLTAIRLKIDDSVLPENDTWTTILLFHAPLGVAALGIMDTRYRYVCLMDNLYLV